jgi:CO dehydrogenase/acetyl-CoA synthase epsilon subunit
MEEIEFIGKRVNLDSKNIKRIKIITALMENEVNGMNEKKKLDYVINKAIESYYASKEIKSLLEL